jgi:hypothetical protein
MNAKSLWGEKIGVCRSSLWGAHFKNRGAVTRRPAATPMERYMGEPNER